ncbi:hypothetical protein [Pseudoxanthomonas gei]|uniref:hypothetical protein n=1 Tax=Pseudoxanthomonas gei TaxID=1383030 RepID=UPI001390CC19|nr:hypothetical protein [Pseudoxanthomonas gei]
MAKHMERLTVLRARRIVGHAETIFSLRDEILDAFDPFASGGAIDRQEACTALLLVISDYYLAVSASPEKRKGYEEYVKWSRVIARRVSSDGINDVGAALKLALDAEIIFDKYIQWLSLQRPSDEKFWPLVYKRLDINNASAPLLSLNKIQSLNMDQLTELIGCEYQVPSSESELREHGFDVKWFGTSHYIGSKQEGISILIEDSTVAAIFLYGFNKDGYKSFPRSLSGGLEFGRRRSHVRAVFGQPDTSNGISDKYDLKKYSVTFEFREWIGTLRLIVICKRMP